VKETIDIKKDQQTYRFQVVQGIQVHAALFEIGPRHIDDALNDFGVDIALEVVVSRMDEDICEVGRNEVQAKRREGIETDSAHHILLRHCAIDFCLFRLGPAARESVWMLVHLSSTSVNCGSSGDRSLGCSRAKELSRQHLKSTCN